MEVETYNCGICGSSFQAEDANGVINPAEVQAAVSACNTALQDAITDIAASLESVRPDACNAIRNYNKDFGYKFDDMAESMEGMKTTASGLLDGLYEQAVELHDRKQQMFNEVAKGQARTCYEKCKAAAEAAAAAAAAAAESGETDS